MADRSGPPEILTSRIPGHIARASELLLAGKVVAIPTDTVYGLAAAAFQQEAVERIYQVKGRSPAAPVPVLIGTAAELSLLVESVPDGAWSLIESFWPGALTLVLPARPGVPTWVTRGGGTIGVRVPASRSCLELLQLLREPIVGTSANRSGDEPATSSREVQDKLGNVIDAVLEDDGSIQSGRASTVVELQGQEATVHRAGAVSVGELRGAFLGHINTSPH